MKQKKKIHQSDNNTLTATETSLEKVLLRLGILRQLNTGKSQPL
jgi:hypothetical protein